MTEATQKPENASGLSQDLRQNGWRYAIGFGVGLAIMGVGLKAIGGSDSADTDHVRDKLAEVIPGAPINHIKCDVGPGLCEVMAGETLIYVSPDGRYGVTGNILDFEAREDLTEGRRAELVKFAALGAGEVVREVVPTNAAAPSAPPTQPAPEAASVVNVSLPIENAAVHRGGQDLPVLHVFSDLNCGYCAKLNSELGQMTGYEVREYFVSWLSPQSRERAAMVLCAEDREDATNRMYTEGSVSLTRERQECIDEYGPIVDQNTEFARSFGMRGTPSIIRQDGTRFPGGYAPKAQLEQWVTS